jgi:hypothetical protein
MVVVDRDAQTLNYCLTGTEAVTHWLQHWQSHLTEAVILHSWLTDIKVVTSLLTETLVDVLTKTEWGGEWLLFWCWGSNWLNHPAESLVDCTFVSYFISIEIIQSWTLGWLTNGESERIWKEAILRHWGTLHETLVRIIGVQTEIWTKHFPNRSPE